MRIGDEAPKFSLPATDGKEYGPNGITVVAFTCNHCPYALAWHDRLTEVAREYDVTFLAVKPNDAERYPRDSFDAMKERVEADGGLPYPYLRDESQDVARAYGAQTTPDVSCWTGSGSCGIAARPTRTTGTRASGPPGCARRSKPCSPASGRRERRPSRSAAASSGGSDHGHRGGGVGEVFEEGVGAGGAQRLAVGEAGGHGHRPGAGLLSGAHVERRVADQDGAGRLAVLRGRAPAGHGDQVRAPLVRVGA